MPSQLIRHRLSRFEDLTTFQAASLLAWRNQSAKRAHSLRSERFTFRVARCARSSQWVSDDSYLATQTIEQPTKVGCHRSTLRYITRAGSSRDQPERNILKWLRGLHFPQF